MSIEVSCRRRHSRFALGADARLTFDFPRPGFHPCDMQLRDISSGGASFVLRHDLPGLDLGFNIEHATLIIGRTRIVADLLVVHVTPDDRTGSTCGALLFPRGDAQIRRLAGLIASLERESESV